MKVLLAQFRKPPTESRFFERIGKALAPYFQEWNSAGCRDVAFINPEKSHSGILPLFQSGKGNFSEMTGNLLRLKDLLAAQKPDMLIFCNPETALLLPLIRLLLPECRVVFDLQENHGLNIRQQIHNPRSRIFSAAIADLLVRTACLFSHRVWLAEKIYITQLPFAAKNSFLLENRPYRNAFHRESPDSPWLFAFTGFISEESGIRRAFLFLDAMAAKRPQVKLLICGYCPDPEIRREIRRHPLVECCSPPERWASDAEIRNCLLRASAQLIPYFETQANEGKTPSKWFSSLALAIPVLYNINSVLHLPEKELLGFPVNFDSPEPGTAENWEIFYRNFLSPEKSSGFEFNQKQFKDELGLCFRKDFSSGKSD